MELVHMGREAGEMHTGQVSEAMAPNPYPYGLRINLTMEELQKLGYEEMPPAGTMLRLEAVGCVTSARTEDPDADGDIDYCCVEVQITELGLEEEGEPEEDEDDDSGERAERMYGKKG